MNYSLVNARIIGKPKNEFFDLQIAGQIVSSIYPAGVIRDSGQIIDLEGGWIAPAFVDAHVHTTNTGVKIAGLDLSRCSSYEELQSIIEKLPQRDDVILGHGWDDSKWSKKADSNIFPKDAPAIYISRIDAHSALASMSLLSRIPQVQDLTGFDPTWPIKQAAHGVIREFAYSLLSKEQRIRYQNLAIDEFLSNGICEIHEMAGPKISSFEDARTFQEHCSTRGIAKQLWWGEINGQQNALSLDATGCGGDLFIDGSLGSKTAFLNDQYSDGGHGVQYISLDDATNHILSNYRVGLPSSFHVIGDAAIDVATQAFSSAKKVLGNKEFSKLQNRLEHAEFLSAENISKLTAMKVTFSMQPKFSSTWAGIGGMYESRIGEDWRKLNPFSDILKSGGRLLFGSDSPVTDINPWSTINAAMNMHNERFSITQKAAFRSSTKNFGQLNVGDVANLAIWDVEHWSESHPSDERHRWSSDARSFPTEFPDSSRPPKCLMTIVDGNILYNAVGITND